MSDYDENLSYIYDTLSDDDLKLQIMEEAAELIQAVCKVIRACKGTNPTPVSVIDAEKNMYEEMADVLVSIDAQLDTSEKVGVSAIQRAKAERWASRIKEARSDEAQT